MNHIKISRSRRKRRWRAGTEVAERIHVKTDGEKQSEFYIWIWRMQLAEDEAGRQSMTVIVPAFMTANSKRAFA